MSPLQCVLDCLHRELHAMSSARLPSVMLSRCGQFLASSRRRTPAVVGTNALRPFSSDDAEAAKRRSAAAEARRSRAAELAEKEEALRRHMEIYSADGSDGAKMQQPGDGGASNKAIADEREFLVAEASAMTKSLYRTCLRSVEILRPGNGRDEADFAEREEAQLRMFDDDDDDAAGGTAGSLSAFSPPVDRSNELESRAEYYAEWTRENFAQEMDCLATEPWREDDVAIYLHFLRVGEERRRWVLKDYGFDDPFGDIFDPDRVDRFEKRATKFLEHSYGSRGWLLAHEIAEAEHEQNGEPCIFDDDEDFVFEGQDGTAEK